MISVTSDSPQIFEPAYYQRLYDIEQSHWWAVGMRDVMVSLFENSVARRQRLRVLDSGCGTGYLCDFLRRYSISGDVVGLDYSRHALRFCQQRGAYALTLASAVEPPFASESFDLIISIDTLQHLASPGADRRACDEFVRVLRPGGVLYLRTNSALGHVPLEGVDPNLYRRYRREEVVAMLSAAGLVIDRATYVNFLPSIWAMAREYLTMRRRKTAPIGPGLSIRPQRGGLVNNLLRNELRFEAWLIGRGIDLPFGHSLAVLVHKP
jgi:SAM-dependent methyltransferase